MLVVEKYLGQWGRYQALLYALCLLPTAMFAIQIMVFNFTAGIPDNRCAIPRVDRPPGSLQEYDNKYFRRNRGYYYTEPHVVHGSESRCYYCDRYYTLITKRTPLCAMDIAESCNYGHVYDTSQYKTTLTSKFTMVCPENAWKHSLAASCIMLGGLPGAAISGVLSDLFGRRPIFLFMSLFGVLSYHLTIFSPNYVILCILNIFNGAFAHGASLIAFVIVMEYIGGLPGTICGIFVQAFFSLGYVYVGICAYLIRDWQILHFVVSIPSVLLIGYYFLLPESIRWLIVNSERYRAKDLIVKGAKFNGHTDKVDEGELMDDIIAVGFKPRGSVIRFFRNHQMARLTIIMFINWFVMAFTYYGLSMNTSDLPGDHYDNHIISGLIEIPAYALIIPMVQKLGRKPSIISCYGLGGVAIIVGTFIPAKLPWLMVAFLAVAKMGIAGGGAVLYIYTAELFPTVARNEAVGFASACARIGAILAPLVYLLAHYVEIWVPYLIYGISALVIAVLDVMLPETLGRPLPDTLDDGIRLASGLKMQAELKTVFELAPEFLAEVEDQDYYSE